MNSPTSPLLETIDRVPSFIILLAAVAVPAVPVVAQTVSCDECDHVAPYFKGEGGFIGSLTDDADEAVFLVSCGNVSISGTAEANEDGTVARLFTMDNGLACTEDGGSLEIAGFAPGGWYWITAEHNSAVAGLVSRDVLDYEATPLTDPGSDDITLKAVKGATFIKQASTGRIGILPNILPEPPVPDAAVCGPRYNATLETYTDEQTTNCVLGDGGTKIRLTGPGAHGTRRTITDGVVSRSTAGNVVVRADLWLNESGSISATGMPNIGWSDKGTDNWLVALWSPEPVGGAPGATLANAGITLTSDGETTSGQGVITISPSLAHCPPTGTQHAVTLEIIAGGTGATVGGRAVGMEVHPPLTEHPDPLFPSRNLTRFSSTNLKVVCPPRSASQP